MRTTTERPACCYEEIDVDTHEHVRIDTKDGLGRALFAQYKFGQQLPTIRYHFPFRDFVIEAVPDGISADYCYEFKLVGERFWYRFVKPVALLQASLYSYFFQRKRYWVDIYVENEGCKETIEGDLDRQWVEDTLNEMDKLLRGSTQPIPPKQVKCPHCDFLQKCPARQF